MTQYSVIATGGKQYLVSPGTKVKVEKLAGEVGGKITFDQVLFTTTGGSQFQVGKPTVAGTVVTGTVIKQGRSKKVTVFKYREKSRYRRTAGHRQGYTEVEID